MEPNPNDCPEPSVDEGAFWHTKMDLYYGYLPGEIVEVEHEPNKYWLAFIQYCYKHLVLLKWVGNYGDEFWVDTSMTTTATSSSGTLHELSNPKRLFPLGYHLQSQLKSQFALEKPSRILVKPSLYNPSKDPYADIRTIDDLLVHEINDQNNGDAFTVKSTSENASLALAKCKTKINYGQEDQDELEAALQSLTGLEKYDESTMRMETPTGKQAENSSEIIASEGSITRPADIANDQTESEKLSNSNDVKTSELQKPSNVASSKPLDGAVEDESKEKTTRGTSNQESPDFPETNSENGDLKHDPERLELCKRLQASAIKNGRYRRIHPTSNKQIDEFFYCKPKQFFDVGGANHERLFVPGTLLEVCHIEENQSGNLDLYYWFAFVVRNVGGRLTLRWFLSDEPKFKQGRLEMKSSRSKLVLEEPDQLNGGDNSCDSETNKVIDHSEATPAAARSDCISSKSLTFSMHFCDPRLHTIADLETTDKKVNYKLPLAITSHIVEAYGSEYLDNITSSLKECIFDKRRMNLDKDRPLIDHILATVRSYAPSYLDLIFAPNDTDNKREILMSCPKITKLLRASVKRELEPGVFEVHSEPLPGTGEILKIVYPYESSYAVLPLEWAKNHEECLSVVPSRNPSPTILVEASQGTAPKSSEIQNDEVTHDTTASDNQSLMTTGLTDGSQPLSQCCSSKLSVDENKMTHARRHCLKEARSTFMRSGGSFKLVKHEKDLDEIKSILGFDEYDPNSWARLLRDLEINAAAFHCCIDLAQKKLVERRFRVMDQLEVVHPSSDSIICLGRIRKVVFPLIWIQLSTDCYTLVPFNSTNIYPSGWCEAHNHKRISLLPPRKRSIPRTPSQQSHDAKRRKKTKGSYDYNDFSDKNENLYENEHFDLGALKDRQADIDYILNEKSAYIKIFFNHKCFTGPSLSKSKICSLPQYVGPGPMRLVVEEVVTKVISVAYVPPRILNDLSSNSFKELLIERNLTNTIPVEFKAKYQKRVHRDTIPVCVNPDDVALYCECICEHIKCCYNLFGMNLYDGDDCPSHCRSLTKSNKFMKRATYYREKARQGEFLNQSNNENGNKKVSNADNHLSSQVSSRARYTGRGSSESTSSSNQSCSDQTNSRTSPLMVQSAACETKENSVSPDAWTIDDVARYLDGCQLGIFKSYMRSEVSTSQI